MFSGRGFAEMKELPDLIPKVRELMVLLRIETTFVYFAAHVKCRNTI